MQGCISAINVPSVNANVFWRLKKCDDRGIHFSFLFTAKNLPEERETNSHTAEQPSVQQPPAGNICIALGADLILSELLFGIKGLSEQKLGGHEVTRNLAAHFIWCLYSYIFFPRLVSNLLMAHKKSHQEAAEGQ